MAAAIAPIGGLLTGGGAAAAGGGLAGIGSVLSGVTSLIGSFMQSGPEAPRVNPVSIPEQGTPPKATPPKSAKEAGLDNKDQQRRQALIERDDRKTQTRFMIEDEEPKTQKKTLLGG